MDIPVLSFTLKAKEVSRYLDTDTCSPGIGCPKTREELESNNKTEHVGGRHEEDAEDDDEVERGSEVFDEEQTGRRRQKRFERIWNDPLDDDEEEHVSPFSNGQSLHEDCPGVETCPTSHEDACTPIQSRPTPTLTNLIHDRMTRVRSTGDFRNPEDLQAITPLIRDPDTRAGSGQPGERTVEFDQIWVNLLQQRQGYSHVVATAFTKEPCRKILRYSGRRSSFLASEGHGRTYPRRETDTSKLEQVAPLGTAHGGFPLKVPTTTDTGLYTIPDGFALDEDDDIEAHFASLVGHAPSCDCSVCTWEDFGMGIGNFERPVIPSTPSDMPVSAVLWM